MVVPFTVFKCECVLMHLVGRGQVTLVELSRPSPTLPELLSGIGNTLVGVDRTLKELLQELTFADGVQARMDGIMFQRLEGYAYANPIFTLIKDYLSSF
jgi:protease-4